jgi:hypothetical protein
MPYISLPLLCCLKPLSRLYLRILHVDDVQNRTWECLSSLGVGLQQDYGCWTEILAGLSQDFDKVHATEDNLKRIYRGIAENLRGNESKARQVASTDKAGGVRGLLLTGLDLYSRTNASSAFRQFWVASFGIISVTVAGAHQHACLVSTNWLLTTISLY